MSVLPQGDVVVASLQHITALAIGVEGGHILSVELEVQGGGGAGLQQLSLGEVQQVGPGRSLHFRVRQPLAVVLVGFL